MRRYIWKAFESDVPDDVIESAATDKRAYYAMSSLFRDLSRMAGHRKALGDKYGMDVTVSEAWREFEHHGGSNNTLAKQIDTDRSRVWRATTKAGFKFKRGFGYISVLNGPCTMCDEVVERKLIVDNTWLCTSCYKHLRETWLLGDGDIT